MATTQWEIVLAMPVTQDRDHIQGPAHAAVTLVQYGGYECVHTGARRSRPKFVTPWRGIARREELQHDYAALYEEIAKQDQPPSNVIT